MPVKARRAKRRPALPAAAFDMAFESGHDYLGDLAALRLTEPCAAPPGPAREAAQAAWLEALRAAWGQHGAAFLAARDPHQAARAEPWALEQFGDPSTCR